MESFRGKQCNAALYLHYPNDTDEVVLFRGANEHDHTNSIHRKVFPEEAKENIEELFDLRLKLKKIHQLLHLGELESLCIEKSTVSQADDEPFVLSYNVTYEDDDDDDNKFRFFISTKRLLKFFATSTRLHADATYKLSWQGFPVVIVGTTDYDRKFYPFGLGVCSDEKQQKLS
ncbi:unnamed protein product [Rotaria socialis]|uniref:Uncharacterized protein n=1 Tax=Rotaria socialis TaxID=392032 RepID=A0A820XWY0_9BILA|nr:unnamed protein product [Rotaria socialis]CAF4597566.1 unnamed protein product [Rotaria socialis]